MLPCAATALFGYFSGQVYDDLNWGFVWMGGSPRSVLLLDCLLESWEHVSFVGHSNFHRRSQPRINHLLEEHSVEMDAARNAFGSWHKTSWLDPRSNTIKPKSIKGWTCEQ